MEREVYEIVSDISSSIQEKVELIDQRIERLETAMQGRGYHA